MSHYTLQECYEEEVSFSEDTYIAEQTPRTLVLLGIQFFECGWFQAYQYSAAVQALLAYQISWRLFRC